MRLSDETRAIVRGVAVAALTAPPTAESILADIEALASNVATPADAVAFGDFIVKLTRLLEGFNASLGADSPADELTAVGSD